MLVETVNIENQRENGTVQSRRGLYPGTEDRKRIGDSEEHVSFTIY
jgi:hypothetical protein